MSRTVLVQDPLKVTLAEGSVVDAATPNPTDPTVAGAWDTPARNSMQGRQRVALSG